MDEARLMTLAEAEEWCTLGSPIRRNPVYEESRHRKDYKHNGEWVYGLEKIEPTEDYMSADIVGYNETVRLWTDKPTEEQMKNTVWLGN